MTETSQLGRHLPDKKILMMPVAHDPVRAKPIGGARFNVAACIVPIRSSTGTSITAFGSDVKSTISKRMRRTTP